MTTVGTKIAAVAAAVLVLAFVAILSLQQFLPVGLLNEEVAAQIKRSTGLSISIDGATKFDALLRPRVVLKNVHVTDAGGATRIDAPEVVAYLRFLPLLVGRMEIGRMDLHAPALSIDLDHLQGHQGTAAGQTADLPGGAFSRRFGVPMGIFFVSDGQAHLKSLKNQLDITVTSLNMRADWPRAAASAEIEGNAVFRGSPVYVQAWLEQPLQTLQGGSSASVFQLKSPIATFWSSGQLSGGANVQFNGSISASAPSLRTLAETVGYSFAKRGTFANLDMSSEVALAHGNATFTNLVLHLDGNDYEGNLEIQNITHTPHFSGTLASDFLDITPFLTGVRQRAVSGGTWNAAPLDLHRLDLANLDLRVSATRLRLYDLEVHDAALSLLTHPGSIDLALAEATSNNGAIKGRFALTEKDHVLDLRMSGSGSGIDLQPMVFESRRPLTGTLDASIGLESSGEDLDDLMRGMSGRATLSASDATFTGVDLIATLTASHSSNSGEKLRIVSGTTGFDHLMLNLGVAHGVATVNSGQASGPNLQLGLVGTIDVGKRQLDLLSLAQITETSEKSTHTVPARFEIKGPWAAPQFYQGPPDIHLPKPARQTDSLPAPTVAPPPQE